MKEILLNLTRVFVLAQAVFEFIRIFEKLVPGLNQTLVIFDQLKRKQFSSQEI